VSLGPWVHLREYFALGLLVPKGWYFSGGDGRATEQGPGGLAEAARVDGIEDPTLEGAEYGIHANAGGRR
jgi:hypothetical protein